MLKNADLSFLTGTWPGLIIFFFLFLLFAAAVMGWGFRFWGRKEEDFLSQSAATLLGGSLFAWFIPTVLGSLGLLQMPLFLWLILLAPGLFWIKPYFVHLGKAVAAHPGWVILFALVFFVRLFGAALPQGHGDPLLYHLLGPRFWVQHGAFWVNPDLPNAILASSWEYFYVWPQRFFFFASGASGLVAAQIFSQWIHLIFGWMGIACLLPLLFREAGLQKRWEFLIALSGLFISGLQWTAALAKNDAGVAFWCLGSVWLLQKALFKSENRSTPFLVGIFAGLAITGKVTAALNISFLFLGLFFCFFWRNRAEFSGKKVWNLILFIALGFLFAALPLYARNLLLTSNPFYPMFNTLIPSEWFSPTWQRHFAQVHPSLQTGFFQKIAVRIPDLFRESPWILFAPAAFLFSGASRRHSYWFLSFFGCLALLLFIATQVKEIELRYMGPVLLVFAGMGVYFFAQLEEKIPFKWRGFYFALFIVLMFATSRLPLHILRKQWSSPLGEVYAKTHTGGEAKAWLRQNMQAGEKVVMAGDNESYYLSTVPTTILTENPALDRATIEEKDLKIFLQKICAITQARYLFDVRPEIGFVARFGKEAGANAIAFEAQGSTIYDLLKLEKLAGVDPNNCSFFDK